MLRLAARGASNQEIGPRLNLTEGTVRNDVTRILQKLGIRDHPQAAARARELGLS